MSEYDLTPDEIRENFSTAINHLTMIKERLIDDLAEKDKEITRLKQRLEKQYNYFSNRIKLMSALKTCPFCGDDADAVKEMVKCQNCGKYEPFSTWQAPRPLEDKLRIGIRKLATFIDCDNCPLEIENNGNIYCHNNSKDCIEELEAWALNGGKE